MRYKHFKNADVSVSALAVGTWAIGGQNYGQVDRSDSVRAIRIMIDQGGNLVDTAPCYGNGLRRLRGRRFGGFREIRFLFLRNLV